jgi:hypothetical protein
MPQTPTNYPSVTTLNCQENYFATYGDHDGSDTSIHSQLFTSDDGSGSEMEFDNQDCERDPLFPHEKESISFNGVMSTQEVFRAKQIHSCESTYVWRGSKGGLKCSNFEGVYYLSHDDVLHFCRIQRIWDNQWRHGVVQRFRDEVNEKIRRFSRYDMEWGRCEKEDLEDILGATQISVWNITLNIYLILWIDGTRSWKVEEEGKKVIHDIALFESEVNDGLRRNLIL